jgi:hypothetical protein
MEEMMKILKRVHAKSINSARKESGALRAERSRNGELRSYFSSGASFEADVWTSGMRLPRKNPRVQSLSTSA